jgi:hypothetical protein
MFLPTYVHYSFDVPENVYYHNIQTLALTSLEYLTKISYESVKTNRASATSRLMAKCEVKYLYIFCFRNRKMTLKLDPTSVVVPYRQGVRRCFQ